ncbi:MAG: signal recognition particle-docking protein FtsY [Actinomycetia bacterium]|nr:signal recognition particle-docking protein FtsY [Actinomycetes bacterium]
MDLIWIILIAVFVVIVAFGVVAVGVTRRATRRTREIAEQFGSFPEAPTKRRPPTRAPPPPPPAPKPLLPREALPQQPTAPMRPGTARAPEVRTVAPAPTEAPEAPAEELTPVEPAPVEVRPRLRDRLGRTRAVFAGTFGRTTLDDAAWDELEESLILADVGVRTTATIIADLRAKAEAQKIGSGEELLALVKSELVEQLGGADRSLKLVPGVTVWMFVGVNGVGKTTTIAKLAQQEVGAGHKVVLAAADTFRAAAADQLEHWAERTGAEIVRGQEGADPGSIVFDAMAAATGRDADLVLVDTAGRLHTKVNLMEELKKLRRIVDRTDGALQEVLLVIDAATGQNGLTQARQFAEAVDVTGVVLTKLDGTAKGGIVLAIQAELGIPVKVIGVGETASDLIAFDPVEFVDALFGA